MDHADLRLTSTRALRFLSSAPGLGKPILSAPAAVMSLPAVQLLPQVED